MFKMVIGLALTIILAGCGEEVSDRKDGFSAAKNPEDSLFQEVMDGHDEAMAKMGKVSGYRKQFEQKIDSLKKTRSAAKAELTKKYEAMRERLKKAEDGMNTWMQEFSIDSAQEDIERRLEYLKSEHIKVDQVKEDILSALSKADSLLKK